MYDSHFHLHTINREKENKTHGREAEGSTAIRKNLSNFQHKSMTTTNTNQIQ